MDALGQLAALMRSNTRPSISSNPGGIAGYQWMLFRALSGNAAVNCAFKRGSTNGAVPFAAEKLPTDLMILAAFSGRIAKLIHAYTAASLRPRAGSAKVSSQPSAPE